VNRKSSLVIVLCGVTAVAMAQSTPDTQNGTPAASATQRRNAWEYERKSRIGNGCCWQLCGLFGSDEWRRARRWIAGEQRSALAKCHWRRGHEGSDTGFSLQRSCHFVRFKIREAGRRYSAAATCSSPVTLGKGAGSLSSLAVCAVQFCSTVRASLAPS